MNMGTARLACVVLLAASLSWPAGAQSPHSHHHEFHDASRWSQVFDDPKRDEWQKPHEVILALRIPADALIADIGAGTGYFASRFAHMAPRGRVYAVDTEPDMVEYLSARAKREGLKNLEAVQAQADDARLPQKVDLAVFVDVYHHVDERSRYLRRLRGSLRENGRVAVIDFRMDAPIGPPTGGRIAPQQVKREFADAGYALEREHDFLPYQYFLVFRPEKP